MPVFNYLVRFLIIYNSYVYTGFDHFFDDFREALLVVSYLNNNIFRRLSSSFILLCVISIAETILCVEIVS